MFVPTASALAVFALVLSAAAAPELSLSVQGPTFVTDVSNFAVVSEITNTGDETLKILNDPRGPLSKLPNTDVYSISNSKGVAASFKGVKAKYVPEVAADAGEYTVLEPGQSVKIEYNLAKAYDFTQTGVGLYEVTPRETFYTVDDKGEVSTIRAIRTVPHTTTLTGKLSDSDLGTTPFARRGATHTRRATFNGCSADQQATISTAASAAHSYAVTGQSYLQSHTSATVRYSTWFGFYTTARHDIVQSRFNAISTNAFSDFAYDCTCTRSDIYAFVYPQSYGTIYLCGAFWQAPASGTDSQAGTLVHEASHFTANGGTIDHVYGKPACMLLAIGMPDDAVENADSIEYFAENEPALA